MAKNPPSIPKPDPRPQVYEEFYVSDEYAARKRKKSHPVDKITKLLTGRC